jgi:hypothetical protein
MVDMIFQLIKLIIQASIFFLEFNIITVGLPISLMSAIFKGKMYKEIGQGYLGMM